MNKISWISIAMVLDDPPRVTIPTLCTLQQNNDSIVLPLCGLQVNICNLSLTICHLFCSATFQFSKIKNKEMAAMTKLCILR